jgi:hypothetical protein
MVVKYKRPDGTGGMPVPPYTKEDRAAFDDMYARMAGTGKYAGRPMVIAHPGPRSAAPAEPATNRDEPIGCGCC